jgi:hypothetical protein
LRRFLPSLLFIVVSVTSVHSQSVLDSLTVQVTREQTLSDYFVSLENKHPVRFFYIDEWLASVKVTDASNGKLLRTILDEVVLKSDLTYTVMFGYAIVFAKDPQGLLERENLLRKAVAEQKDITVKVFGDPTKFTPGKKVILSGVIREDNTQSLVANVPIWVNTTEVGSSDVNGNFRIELTGGQHIVRFQNFNYKEKIFDLKIYEDAQLNIILEPAPVVLEEVVVSDQAVVNRRVGQSTLKMANLKRAPLFLGEVDVIKQVQNQPGVTTVGEVASGFNVRGGGVDQNLVLYDGVPIFNTSHALGFFTAFNSDAINQVSFYRGGIPAEYGGRVSSVLDISSKEGSGDVWKGGGGIGIISSYLTIGGPIKRDTTTIIASVRASYSDWMLGLVRSDHQDLANSSLSFYDASLKLSHKFSKSTKLTVSGYTSFDRFSLTNDTVYTSRNIAASARLDKSFSDKLFGSIALSYGSYGYSMQDDDPQTAFHLDYGVTYPSLKLDFNHEGTHKLSFGLHSTMYEFSPGEFRPASNESGARSITITPEKSFESAIYLSDAFYLGEKLFVEGGLRVSMFNRVGPGTVYLYQPDKAIEPRNMIDSVSYGSGDIIKTYTGLEPRFSARYTLGGSSSVKFGYNRMYQYMHLVTNTAAVAPVDIWQSSNTYFKPQIADQFSLGYFRNLAENSYETFVEFFYKKVSNSLDFKDGSQLILNPAPETTLLNGKGTAYGAEFSISKITGRLQGALNYTYSRSWRETNGQFAVEKINNGKQYPSNYDQPHVVQMNWRYGLSRRHYFSGTFVYHTGRPMSVPVATYDVNGVSILQFSDRNSARIPDYHRLDLALIIEGNHRRKKLWDGQWVISFYNVYSRKNAYSVFYKEDNNGLLQPYKLSVIGSIVPSLSYSFKF